MAKVMAGGEVDVVPAADDKVVVAEPEVEGGVVLVGVATVDAEGALREVLVDPFQDWLRLLGGGCVCLETSRLA